MSTEPRFGSWIVEHPVGRGGMAVVYRCHHADDPQRLAAVKVLEGESAERLARLDLEVRLLHRLDHPNIVGVHDHLLGRGCSWLAMDLVDGKPLHDARPEAQPVDEVVRIGVQIADALDYLHRSGVWHRDIKPGNLLVERDSGRVRLVDFGIALAADEDRLTAEDHRAPVTLSYAPPEWFGDEPPSPAPCDAYALGVVLHELLTGQRAFVTSGGGDLMADLCLQKAAVPHLDPGPAVPDPVREVVVGLTEADVDQRWAVRRALERLRAIGASRVGSGPAGAEAVLPRPPALPEPRDGFVGRSAELARVAEWLADGARLVTLLGPPGTGKTRLALRVAAGQEEAWPGGVWFVDLAEARDADGLRRAVARTLGIPLVEQDPEAQLAGALDGMGRVLLVLDNLEQAVAHVSETVGRWVGATRQAAYLCTSRERLGLSGERVLRLAPLDVPDEDASLEEIAASEAVALFVERARAVAPGRRWTGAALREVASAVRALDGLPLAIELAASSLSMGHAVPSRLSRHPTLRAALDASWALLSEIEQRTLAQLTAFEGGLSLEAAEAVVDVPGDVLDALQRLVDRSWLLLRRHEGGFGMLASVRAYASDHLDALGERAAVELRHGRHFAQLAALGNSSVVRLPRSAFTNLRAAVERAIERADADIAVRCALVLARAAYRLGPLAPSLERIPRVLALGGPPTLERVLLRTEYTKLLERSLQDEPARAQAALVVEEAHQLGEPLAEGLARMELGRQGWLERPAAQTLGDLDRALALLREAGAPRDLVWGLCLRANLGHALRERRLRLVALLDEALVLLERHPDPYLLAMVLAVKAMATGASLDPLIRLARRNGFRALWLDAMCMAGLAALEDDALDRAHDLLTSAWEGARRLGFAGRRADCASALASLALKRGEIDVAERFCDEVHALRGEGPDDAHALLCDQRGLIAAGRGQHDEAERWFERARQRSGDHPHVLRVEMLAQRAEMLVQFAWHEGARAALDEAEAMVAADPLPDDSAAAARLRRARAAVRSE